jgi:hypothetical protein
VTLSLLFREEVKLPPVQELRHVVLEPLVLKKLAQQHEV